MSAGHSTRRTPAHERLVRGPAEVFRATVADAGGCMRVSRFVSVGSQRGFTLLEILVVVVIVGVLVTFATLSVGGRSLDDRLEFEARRLEKTFQLALEEAEIKGLLIGFRYTPDRYEFVGLNAEGKWAAYAESGPFRARALTRPFEILLSVEGRPVPPAQDPKDEESEPEPSPGTAQRPHGLLLRVIAHQFVRLDGVELHASCLSRKQLLRTRLRPVRGEGGNEVVPHRAVRRLVRDTGT